MSNSQEDQTETKPDAAKQDTIPADCTKYDAQQDKFVTEDEWMNPPPAYRNPW